MYFIYSLLLTLGFIILLPRFVLEALRGGKYVTGLRQRLGNLPAINSKGKPVIWLHCVSVGEAQAAQSLVREISNRFPKLARPTGRGRTLSRPGSSGFLLSDRLGVDNPARPEQASTGRDTRDGN